MKEKYPCPIKLSYGQYTFKNPDGTLWSDVYGEKAVFTYISDFHEGFACVQVCDGRTFVDCSGNLLEHRFLSADNFQEGFARVVLKNHDYAFLDKNGNVIEHGFKYASGFRDGFAHVELKNGDCTFVDRNGDLIKHRFLDTRDFHEGFAAVQLKNGDWTFIDANCELMKHKFKYASNFHQGFAAVKLKSGDWTFVDTNGEFMRHRFWSAKDFHEGFAVVELKGGYRTFVDTDGNFVAHKFVGANDFHEGFAPVTLRNGSITFMDANGNLMKCRFEPSDYISLNNFCKGLAQFRSKFDPEKLQVLDKYENIWEGDEANQLYKIYSDPQQLFELKNIDKKYFKTALSVIKQKLVDMEKSSPKEKFEGYKAKLNEKIQEKFGDLVEELRQDRIYVKYREY